MDDGIRGIYNPVITTIRQPAYEMGMQAAKIMLSCIEDKGAGVHTALFQLCSKDNLLKRYEVSVYANADGPKSANVCEKNLSTRAFHPLVLQSCKAGFGWSYDLSGLIIATVGSLAPTSSNKRLGQRLALCPPAANIGQHRTAHA
jgi:hypothetical protein